jgi:uncharacterized cupredoxin-like copper-binding protein
LQPDTRSVWRLIVLALLLALPGAVPGTCVAAESGAADATRVDWSKAQLVDLAATEYDFIPNHLTFHSGLPYRLHLDNRGEELHELTAPEFFKSVLAKNPDVLTKDGTDFVVQPHEAKDLYFVPKRPGQYKFICADHDWAGMTGDITVE